MTPQLSELGFATISSRIDAALAPLNVEEALHAPGVAPRVCANPVVYAVLLAPTNDLDGMATSLGTRSVVVDATLVGEKVLIDIEASLKRAVSKNFGLNGSSTGGLDDGARSTLVLLSN